MLLGVLLWLAQGWAQEADGLWRQGRRAEAIEVLSAAAREAPTDELVRRRLAEAELAVHRYAAALAHAEGLGTELDGLRGSALYRLGEFERALAVLGRDDVEALLMRIDCFEALARFDEAERDLARLLELTGARDARVAVLQGRCAARKGDTRLAESCYRRALALDATDAAALFGLGTLCVRSERREEGLKLLAEHRRVTPLLDKLDFARRSIDLAPAHGPNHAALGDAERALGHIEAAENAYRRAQELARPDELTPIVLRHARLLAEDRRDASAAVRLLDEVHARAADVRLLVRAGDVLLECGRREEALARFEAALRLRPNDGEIEKRARAARGAP